MNTNIHLITGNTGFVGLNLNKYLTREKKQTLGVSRTPEKGELSYQKLSAEDFNKAKSFIHLAGKAHDLKNVSKPEEYFEVNTDLTIKLFDLFLNSTCNKFIFISTVKAVTDNVKTVLTEDFIADPLTPYGKSKLAAEKYILSKEIPPDKKVYILRPCMIHGPENKGNLNLLFKFTAKGIPYPLGKFNNLRSFTSIENLCFIINELLEQDIESGIYNIADDQPISTKELVILIGKEINKPVRIVNFPIWSVKMLAKVGSIMKIPFNSHRLDKLTESYVVSNDKIKNELKINLPIATIEGLKRTIKSF